MKATYKFKNIGHKYKSAFSITTFDRVLLHSRHTHTPAVSLSVVFYKTKRCWVTCLLNILSKPWRSSSSWSDQGKLYNMNFHTPTPTPTHGFTYRETVYSFQKCANMMQLPSIVSVRPFNCSSVCWQLGRRTLPGFLSRPSWPGQRTHRIQ